MLYFLGIVNKKKEKNSYLLNSGNTKRSNNLNKNCII